MFSTSGMSGAELLCLSEEEQMAFTACQHQPPPPHWISGASRDKDRQMRHRDGEGRGGAQDSYLSARPSGSVGQNLQMCVEKDLVSSGWSMVLDLFMCVFALLIIFSCIQSCGRDLKKVSFAIQVIALN